MVPIILLVLLLSSRFMMVLTAGHGQTTLPGLQPRVVIDAGAYAGEWTTDARKQWPKAQYIMIEASPSKRAKLETICLDNCTLYNYLLGETSRGTRPYFDGETGASVFRENTHHFANTSATQLEMRTIDDIVQESSKEGLVDVIKLDIQGSELNALRGAIKTLESVKLIILEVGIVNYNPGSACYFEVDEFLRQHGFAWYSYMDGLPNLMDVKGLGQANLAYVKRTFFDNAGDKNYCLDRQVEATPAKESHMSSNGDYMNNISHVHSFLSGIICGIFVSRVCGLLYRKKNSKRQ